MGARVMRGEGWELRLSQAIEDARGRPFVWGEHDCAAWAATVVEAMTGLPFRVDWRGRYRNARGSRRFLRRQGFAGLDAAVTARLGPPLASPSLAARGDIVMAAAGGLGVCIGRAALFLAPGQGLTSLPVADCQMAWAV